VAPQSALLYWSPPKHFAPHHVDDKKLALLSGQVREDAMAWYVEVYASSVECADTESVTVDDLFAIVGSVLVDDKSHGFITPPMAVGPGETHDMGGYPTGPGQLYQGWSDSPRLGYIVRGYDIDDNDKWVNNRETIKKVVEAIEKITDDIPVVGDIVSVAAKIPDVIDVFVDADSDDLVLGHTG
jgi:hypothetical protein